MVDKKRVVLIALVVILLVFSAVTFYLSVTGNSLSFFGKNNYAGSSQPEVGVFVEGNNVPQESGE